MEGLVTVYRGHVSPSKPKPLTRSKISLPLPLNYRLMRSWKTTWLIKAVFEPIIHTGRSLKLNSHFYVVSFQIRFDLSRNVPYTDHHIINEPTMSTQSCSSPTPLFFLSIGVDSLSSHLPALLRT